MAASRVAVFLDYQNVHLMAHGLFMPYGTPVQDALVHPLRVAERLVAKRRDDSELSSVRVFRGRPNPGRQPIPVEMAFRRTTPRVEIAAWSGARPLWFPTEMAAGRRLPWCHFLGQQDFDAVRDQAIYIPKP